MKKKITFLLLMIFASANIYSQNYTISFAASGAATTLDSVRIINLTHPDTAMWHDGDIFQLQLNNAINEIVTNKENLHIFPNPMQGKAEIMFNVKQAGIASINIYEITGKEIIHSDENLSQGNHQFQLTGLKQGAYFINIRGNGYFYSSKLISYNSFSNDINLKYNGVIQETLTNKYKTTNSSINFSFVSGDILQYTGYAANLTAVVTNSPTSDITITFSFIASIPSLTTNAATSITTNSAISGGNVTSDGGEIVTARGICYATTNNPTITNNIVSGGSGTGIFTTNLTGLTPGTTYYVRAYATNSLGTAYGNEISFTTTSVSLPVLTTTNISSITSNTAISGGNITSDGGAFVSVRGVCWSTSPNPTIALSTKTTNGANTGSYTSNIIGLTAGTTYYVRAYATNSIGTAYGNEISFTTTSVSLPVLTTTNISSITDTTATSGGNISTDGGAFISVRGVCWSTSPNPTIALITKTINGADTGSFTSNITGLTDGTTYYVRAYATNSIGTAYGNGISFTTPFPVYDIDGNGYDTVHIGNQIWMKQNLKTTHYKNGAAITYPGTNKVAWLNHFTGNYAWYNDDSVLNKNTYGALYDWYAVKTGNLCPTGWHVPSDAEWSTLTNYLGGDSIAGGKLKAITLWWESSVIGDSNSSGFTALPGGGRFYPGDYIYIRSAGRWWSSTEFSSFGWCRGMWFSSNEANRGSCSKESGFSVRCISGLGFQASLPTITTTAVTTTLSNYAISGGNITSDGGAYVNSRGVCWSTSPNPTIALYTKTVDSSDVGNFTSNIWGLLPDTTYYVRAYATNISGTVYGNEISFTTLPLSNIYQVYDIDNNAYDTVHIGTQVWMKQNLKTTHYNNGTAINYHGTYYLLWDLDNTGAYTYYNNDASTYKNTYGLLYNWYAVNTGNLCPTGWHVPTDAEWTTLTTYLGGESIAGGKLKATTLWNNPNTGATNETGFSVLPSGQFSSYFNGSGNYGNIGISSTLWSSSSYFSNNTEAWSRTFSYTNSLVYRYYNDKNIGFSVRCIKDLSSQSYLPSLTTTTASAISSTTATTGGNISSDGGAAITARGVCWSTTSNPTVALSTKTNDGTGTGSFISNITGLTAVTTYFVRAYATNSAGTAYGNEVIFTNNILASLPVITTTNVSSITINSALSGGNVTSDGGEIVIARGICYSTTANPTIANAIVSGGSGTGLFTANLIGLNPGTTYYLRAYATNSLGTAYGNEVSFATVIPTIGTIIDYDGNVYDTVQIGTQVWMKQNLKTTHYKNGTAITYPGTNNTAWQNNTTGAYAWYNNDEATYKNTYGALYNWYAVNTGNLCPTGWHVPTDAEWSTLTTYLGGESIAGGKLKATTLWISPNTGATNSSGFSALPGGDIESYDGAYYGIANYCYLWSSTESNTTEAWIRFMFYYGSNAMRIKNIKTNGYSVRCIKN
jgi:uncharacterized protein (TIGR02145 family)